MQQAFSGVDNEVLALVGADVTAKLATMDSQVAVRQQIQMTVGNDLANTNVPLTAAQTQALAAAVLSSGGQGGSLMDQIRRIAPGVLTADQLALVQQSLDFQARSQKLVSEAEAAAQTEHPEVLVTGTVVAH